MSMQKPMEGRYSSLSASMVPGSTIWNIFHFSVSMPMSRGIDLVIHTIPEAGIKVNMTMELARIHKSVDGDSFSEAMGVHYAVSAF